MDGSNEADIPEDREDETSVDYAAKKRRIVMLLLGCSAIFGVIACFLPAENTAADFILNLPMFF